MTDFISGLSNKRSNVLSSSFQYRQDDHANSMEGDEYCRITIDSLTKSYKIGLPVQPKPLSSKQMRSTSHSLLTAPYAEGKQIEIGLLLCHMSCIMTSLVR
jgi:hypothetical protein